MAPELPTPLPPRPTVLLQKMMHVLVLVVIAIGLCLDGFSCYLELKKNRAASGLLASTAIIFYALPLLLYGRPVLTPFVWV